MTFQKRDYAVGVFAWVI